MSPCHSLGSIFTEVPCCKHVLTFILSRLVISIHLVSECLKPFQSSFLRILIPRYQLLFLTLSFLHQWVDPHTACCPRSAASSHPLKVLSSYHSSRTLRVVMVPAHQTWQAQSLLWLLPTDSLPNEPRFWLVWFIFKLSWFHKAVSI